MKILRLILLASFLALISMPVLAMDDQEILTNPQVIVPAKTGKTFEVLTVGFDKDSATVKVQWYDTAGMALYQEDFQFWGADYTGTVQWVITAGNAGKTLRTVMINKFSKAIKIIKGLQ